MFRLMIIIGCCLCLIASNAFGRVVVKKGKMVVRGPVVIRP